MEYALGVTLANLQALEDLDLPEPLFQPLSDFAPFSATRQRMDGLLVGTGLPTFTWHFNELTIGEMGTLLEFVTVGGVLQASNVVYARTRIIQAQMAARVFASYRCIMLLPFEPDDAGYDVHFRYRDVEVKFIHAEVQ
jgi:hypothetical protein